MSDNMGGTSGELYFNGELITHPVNKKNDNQSTTQGNLWLSEDLQNYFYFFQS
mgnify:CR=1 FL=1